MHECAGCHRQCYGAVQWLDDDGERHVACSVYCKQRKQTLHLVS